MPPKEKMNGTVSGEFVWVWHDHQPTFHPFVPIKIHVYTCNKTAINSKFKAHFLPSLSPLNKQYQP